MKIWLNISFRKRKYRNYQENALEKHYKDTKVIVSYANR